MYVPAWFREDRPEILHELMRRFSFAALVTNGDGGVPDVSHLPFLLDAGRGVLSAHLARANPQWRAFADGGRDALVIFQGPHAYVSPTVYAAQPSVPTWNYTVVHASGPVRLLSDEELFAALHALVSRHEPEPAALILPDEFVRKTMAGIVGVELEITRLEGKFKLSQNKDDGERARVREGLRATDAADVAELMKEEG